jgi:hypothetical protein
MGADGQDALGGDLCSVKNSPRANAVKTSRKVMSLAGRQFETASRTEPSADQSGCRHQRERPANHDRIGVGAIRHILRTQDLPWVGDQSRQQMNADGKSGARSRRSFVAERAPILQSRSRLPLRVNDGQPTSDRAAAQASRTLAAARPAAGLEPPAAADEVRAAEPRPAAGERERPAARAPGARGPPGAQDEAREVVRLQAPRARASPQEPDEALTGRERLALEHEAQPAEPERAARRPAAELRHWASALGCLLALAAAASEPGQETPLER